MAATVHIAVGFSWIAQAEEEEHERIIKQVVVVLVCCTESILGCSGADLEAVSTPIVQLCFVGVV